MNTNKTIIFNTVIALTLTCGAAAGLAQSDQPSLGDAARRARAEKKDAPKNAKVFTNDDVGSLKGTINVVGPDPAPAADTSNPAAAKVASAAPAGPGKGEAYFRNKFVAARRALADDSRELDVLQREFGLKQTQYYSDPNVAMREQYGREDLNKTQGEIDTKKADVAKDQQAISDLEDELRRAGGDTSWENAQEATTAAGNTSDTTSPTDNAVENNSAPRSPSPDTAPQQPAPQGGAAQ